MMAYALGGVLIATLAMAAPLPLDVAAQQAGAAAQANRSHKFGPGECGRVDPTYIRLANETGGHPFFLNPSETAKAFHYIRETSTGRQATLLWATGTLESGRVEDFDVPIDSTTRRVTFALSVDTFGSDFAILDPAGATVDV